MAFTGNNCSYCKIKTLTSNERYIKDGHGYKNYCSSACKFRAIGIVGYVKDFFARLKFNIKVTFVGMDNMK